MKWSKLRARLLELLAPSLSGRVDFHAATFRRSTGQLRVWIAVDGEVLTTVARSFLRWHDDDGLPPEGDLAEAAYKYLDVPFERSLASPDPFVRGLAMLDRRLGKRRLRAVPIGDEQPFVRLLYALRCEAEGLPAPDIPDGVTLGMPERKRARRRALQRLDAERERAAWKEARGRLSSRRREEDVAALLARLREGDVPREVLRTPTARLVHEAMRGAGHPDALAAELRWLAKRSRLLDSPRRARGVLSLLRLRGRWLRPLLEWQPRSKSGTRQFSELARHLFGRGPVPAFLDKAWLDGLPAQQEWFAHVGATGSLFGAPGLPIAVTRRMAACFAEAPEEYPVLGALRFAQVHALGGDRRVSDGLLGTSLAREFADDAFWTTVVRFFIAHPLLDTAHYGPIVDFARARRAEQPRFSMRGRTPESLLREVERWHRDLRARAPARGLSWAPSGIGTLEEEGDGKAWRSRELLTGDELSEEGEAMNHCVATYARSCKAGLCSIWSLQARGEDGAHERRLTVEVENASREVRQARGRRNRLPNPDEMGALRRWAASAGLIVGDWLLR